jgi:hypothetical protein
VMKSFDTEYRRGWIFFLFFGGDGVESGLQRRRGKGGREKNERKFPLYRSSAASGPSLQKSYVGTIQPWASRSQTAR